jgi:uncharacterized protein YrrD
MTYIVNNKRNTTMLIKTKTLAGCKLHSLDGEIGKVDEFYFDDKHWTVRYLVANTGNWLTGRLVLISPYALKAVDKDGQTVAVNLTKKQIEESPSLDTDKPVSQQFEVSYYGYYGWPTYWGGTFMWGHYPYIVRDPERWKITAQEKKTWDLNLRSTHEVRGYHIQAKDGEIGHVEDFIIDDETWAIRYLIIDTQNWWPGKKVLLSPKWIHRVSWSESKAFIDLPRETIKQSPEYTDGALLSRDYETELHHHYKRQGYWAEE